MTEKCKTYERDGQCNNENCALIHQTCPKFRSREGCSEGSSCPLIHNRKVFQKDCPRGESCNQGLACKYFHRRSVNFTQQQQKPPLQQHSNHQFRERTKANESSSNFNEKRKFERDYDRRSNRKLDQVEITSSSSNSTNFGNVDTEGDYIMKENSSTSLNVEEEIEIVEDVKKIDLLPNSTTNNLFVLKVDKRDISDESAKLLGDEKSMILMVEQVNAEFDKKKEELTRKLLDMVDDREELSTEGPIIRNERKLLEKQQANFQRQVQQIFSLKDQYPLSTILHALYRECCRGMKSLPLYAFRSDIIASLQNNNVIICIGETGSGKSTQIPQYIIEEGYGRFGKVVCTEPRAVAAMSLTKRISQEMSIKENSLVSHNLYGKVNNWSDLLFMTDRKLLNEFQNDALLSKYSVIIVDEAHERNLCSDILISLLKECVIKRSQSTTLNPLKLIITSATIDENLFSTFFNNCPVIKAPGRMYPVDVYWTKQRKEDYEQAAVQKVLEIISNNKLEGDILVFLSSPDEIDRCIKKLEFHSRENRALSRCLILPLHGALTPEEQERVFERVNSRRIIFSTRIAENSVTIDGVKIIVDTGVSREKFYDQQRNMSILKVNNISQSSAIQRKGRAGRTSSGVCFRLFSEQDFSSMSVNPTPEILNSNLGLTLLRLFSAGVKNILEFDLIEKPNLEDMKKSLKNLTDLQFVDEKQNITQMGKQASKMEIEPSLARMIIEGINLGIGDEIIQLVSIMSFSNMLYAKSKSTDYLEKDIMKVSTSKEGGDLITLLHIFQGFLQAKDKRRYAKDGNFSLKTLIQAEETMTDIRKRLNLERSSNSEAKTVESIQEIITRCVCCSMFDNFAYFHGIINGKRVYKILSSNMEAFIHGSSFSNYSSEPIDYVIYGELVKTEKLFMKNVTPISLESIKPFITFNQSLNVVKKKVIYPLTRGIFDCLNANNGALLEYLRLNIGSIVEMDPDRNELVVYLSEGDQVETILKYVYDTAVQRSNNEFLEHQVDSKVRALIGRGMQVVKLLFPGEFVKCNILNIPNMDYNHLREVFEMHNLPILDCKLFFELPSNRYGTVIFDSPETSKKARELFSDCQEFRITTSDSTKVAEEKEMKNYPLNIYFYSEHDGKCFIYSDNANALNIIQSQYLYGQKMFRNIEKKNLKIANLSFTLDEHRIRDFIPRELHNDIRIVMNRDRLGKEQENQFVKKMVNTIRPMMELFGELEMFEYVPTKDLVGQYKILAKFTNLESTMTAMKSLNGASVGDKFIWVEPEFTDIIPFPLDLDTDNLFREELRKMMKEIFSVYGCRSGMFEMKNGRQKALKVRANSEEGLTRAMAIAHKYLKPYVLKLGVFDFSIAFKKKFRILELTKNFKAYIDFDIKNNNVNIYQLGINQMKDIVTTILQEIRNSNKDIIKLTQLKPIIGNQGKVLKSLQEKYGGRIDFDYKQKIISINSSDQEEINNFKQEIRNILESHQSTNEEISPEDCPICYGPKENPVLLSCGHSLCRDCFICQLDQMTFNCCECDSLLTIPEINLSQDLNLIEKQAQYAVEKYLERHPNDFKHCSSAHCSGIVCIDQSQVAHCQSCNKTYCIKCNEPPHPGLDCSNEEEALIIEWKKANTKPCPKCKNNIEKNGGCNHITCYYCGAHFCWLCGFLANGGCWCLYTFTNV